MPDPRDVHLDKQVHEQKKARGIDPAPEGATHAPQPGRKTPVDKDAHPDARGAGRPNPGDAAGDHAAEDAKTGPGGPGERGASLA